MDRSNRLRSPLVSSAISSDSEEGSSTLYRNRFLVVSMSEISDLQRLCRLAIENQIASFDILRDIKNRIENFENAKNSEGDSDDWVPQMAVTSNDRPDEQYTGVTLDLGMDIRNFLQRMVTMDIHTPEQIEEAFVDYAQDYSHRTGISVDTIMMKLVEMTLVSVPPHLRDTDEYREMMRMNEAQQWVPQFDWGPTLSLDPNAAQLLQNLFQNLITTATDGSVTVNHTLDYDRLATSINSVRVNHDVPAVSGIWQKLMDPDNILVDVGSLVVLVFTFYKSYHEQGSTWRMGFFATCAFMFIRNPTVGRYLDTFKETFKKREATSDDEYVEQFNFENVFLTGIMGYLYTTVVARLGSGISLEKFIKETASFEKYKRSTEFTFNFVLDLIQKALNWVCEQLNLKKFEVARDPWPDASAWLEEASAVVTEHERTLECTYSLFNRVIALRKRGEELKRIAEKRREYDKHYKYICDVMFELGGILSRLQRASIIATGPRIEPVGVMIAGNAGVGKTTSSGNAMLDITAQILEPSELDRFVENHNDFIYNRVSEEEFFTGYHGQTVFNFDDIGQTRDVAGVLNTPFMESIRAINSNNYIVHMAALPDKGTVAFNSKLVWATTNREVFSKDIDSLYIPDAFIRRWTAYWCAPRVGYCVDDKLQVKQRKLDITKIDPDDIEFHHLEWYPYNIRNGDITGPSVTYREFVDQVVALYKHKFQWGKRLLDNNQKTKLRAIARIRKERDDDPVVPQMGIFSDEEWISDGGTKRTLRDRVNLGRIDMNRVQQDIDNAYYPQMDTSGDADEDIGSSSKNPRPPLIGLQKGIAKLANPKNLKAYNAYRQMEQARQAAEVAKADYERKMKEHEELYSVPGSFEPLEGEKLSEGFLYVEPERLWVYRFIRRRWPGLSEESAYQIAASYDGPCSFTVQPGDTINPYAKVEPYIVSHVVEILEGEERRSASNKTKQTLRDLQSWLSEKAKTHQGPILKSLAALGGVVAVLGLAKVVYNMFAKSDNPTPQSSWRRGTVNKQALLKAKVKLVKTRKPGRTGGPKGHQQRGGRDYSMTAEMGTDVAEDAQPQGCIDQATDDILLKLYRRSMYLVSSEGISTRMGYLTMLCGNIGIVPMHFWCTWQQMQIDAGKDLVLSFKRIGNDTCTEVLLNDIECWTADDLLDRDLAYLLMPVYFDKGPDVRKHFATRKDIPKDRFNGTILLPRDGILRSFNTDMSYKNNMEYSDWELPDSFEYAIATKDGDCGTWIGMNNPATGTRKILGMHVAGKKVGNYGCAVGVTWDEIDEMVSLIEESTGVKQITEEWIPQMGDLPLVEPHNRFTTLSIEEKGVVAPINTVYRKSVLAQDFAAAEFAPARLRPFRVGNDIIDPWINARVKYNLSTRAMRMDVLTMCADSYANRMFSHSHDNAIIPNRIYSFEDAVRGLPGVPFADGIPRNTSPGYPWVLTRPKNAKGKHYMFGDEGDYEFTSTHCEDVRKRVEHIVEEAKKSRRLKHVYADFLKDERRPLEKVATGKTRLISASPIDYLIASRMYFMDFVRWYYTNNVRNGSAIGANVYGPDWTRVVHYLAAQLGLANLIAGDFRHYDGSLWRAVLFFALYIVEKYYAQFGSPNYEEEKKVRAVLFEDVANSKHIVDRSIYEWTSSLPSGCFLTALMDTLANQIVIRYACVCIQSKNLGNETRIPSLKLEECASFLEEVEANMRILTFGDDNVISVGKSLQGLISQASLTEAFATFDFEYLDEAKTGKIKPLRTLSEISFLKRGFTKEPTEDGYVAPLDLRVILDIIKWTRKTDYNSDILKDNVEVALRELSLHPKSVWNKHAPSIIASSIKRISYSPKASDYAITRHLVRNGECFL